MTRVMPAAVHGPFELPVRASSPFDASVAKFSLDRIAAPDSTNAQKALFEPIESVEVVDPATIRIRLSRPMATLPYLLAWGDAVMVSPRTVAVSAIHALSGMMGLTGGSVIV